jgi:hypothetical protein
MTLPSVYGWGEISVSAIAAIDPAVQRFTQIVLIAPVLENTTVGSKR